MAQNKAIVLVHPFDSTLYESQRKYLLQRNKIIREEKNLFVLAFDLQETLYRIGPRPQTIIATQEANPQPRIGWERFSEMLKGYDEVIFTGAELHLDETNTPYTGCVLDAFEKTNVPFKKINRDACWIGF